MDIAREEWVRKGSGLDDCFVPKDVFIGPLLLHDKLEAPKCPSIFQDDRYD